MNTIFIGGSREVARLPQEVQARLDEIIKKNHHVIVGDANGADKAVQKYLADREFQNVTLFCSGDTPRNNVGHWKVQSVTVNSKTKDYQFFAAKDREMARRADFGLMIWDGKSPGTLLNLVRLLQGSKIAVLINVPQKQTHNIKTADQLREFYRACTNSIRSDLERRATGLEMRFLEGLPSQPDFLEAPAAKEGKSTGALPESAIQDLNAALASGDIVRITDLLGALARNRGMSQIARDTNLARESLYRSLDAGGNPEFATVLKVLTSLGIDLEVRKTSTPDRDR
ncbi:addiction module antidote protein [Hyphomicrobium sp. DMF-1]|uniref:addiction module antidote protein n=1 Tax=Hyphomicrobium sp. DMF-1 TaxID=3019544 RepID=UPI0022EBF8A7|nr:addiction module antidote protein [Hyphomicrobium sp. DMF-1]WBT37758.1 putative addiction module antidote protein [Hyphomicrobium sp. DMF-1]